MWVLTDKGGRSIDQIIKAFGSELLYAEDSSLRYARSKLMWLQDVEDTGKRPPTGWGDLFVDVGLIEEV